VQVPSNELRSTQSATRAEGLEKLPHDYDGWRPIPKLGFPTGELGRPVLREERNVGLDPYSANFKPNPDEDAERVARLRLQDEAEAAAMAQVFFQISHGGHESAARETSAADMPAVVMRIKLGKLPNTTNVRITVSLPEALKGQARSIRRVTLKNLGAKSRCRSTGAPYTCAILSQ
jgi:hypothetical protein